ncbi:MAG TPA: diaminopimelate epimerase [Thermodesulfobium narugense]|uniref:Diaminopimelate epimerase n=1 Tax=Thermodesulfobium acidiphilum TaxID=1794699 RepID=A0A2R4W1D9_THEAF|nr:diaminopimelate epimerase [Thermodesulfobium acidiphilum]AWB10520.1 diaminopimelate epimerase [Thermodesulfobium acidiphilum]PMP84853.1 MAG: diaminopimelate epimerase [Thermodesulfobium narugense]HEM55561.1 diaminopimelate epimerase [Thermodesulfobium narugense]
MKFYKMHGTGNDFVMLLPEESKYVESKNPSEISKQLCDRHFGIGSDGLILMLSSDKADLKMRIFNADGSEAEMCGNGIRCFAKLAKDMNIINKDKIEVETLAGIIVPEIIKSDGKNSLIRVNMGIPNLKPESIPILGFEGKDSVINQRIQINDKTFLNVTCVSMGNPHCIIFMDYDIKSFPIEGIAPDVEHSAWFPKKTNVEFARVISKNDIELRVWERGVGETLACGTGACATAVAAKLNGFTNGKVNIHLPGGILHIEYETSNVFMTATATLVFEGIIEI